MPPPVCNVCQGVCVAVGEHFPEWRESDVEEPIAAVDDGIAQVDPRIADDAGVQLPTKDLILRSLEGDELRIPPEAARQSIVLCSWAAAGDDGEVIPVTKLRTHVLKKVIEYCNMHLSVPCSIIVAPVTANLRECGASEADASFVESLLPNELADLSIAADFLNIPGLLHLTCARQAAAITHRTSLSRPHDWDTALQRLQRALADRPDTLPDWMPRWDQVDTIKYSDGCKPCE
mmetsp:Transcript_60983/g.163575  ORF Transcript_60983/g.163575 Transcript_60983/m.163575 type:complete len:233 (+) Transcript_60983:25-723(+)